MWCSLPGFAHAVPQVSWARTRAHAHARAHTHTYTHTHTHTVPQVSRACPHTQACTVARVRVSLSWCLHRAQAWCLSQSMPRPVACQSTCSGAHGLPSHTWRRPAPCGPPMGAAHWQGSCPVGTCPLTHLFLIPARTRSDGAGQKNLNCMFSGEGVKAQHEGAAASGEGAYANIAMQVGAVLEGATVPGCTRTLGQCCASLCCAPPAHLCVRECARVCVACAHMQAQVDRGTHRESGGGCSGLSVC